jgi:hypothetical protein
MTGADASDRGIDFDVARLDEYLKGWLGGADPTRVERTHGGMSNPTYFVTRGEWRAVLRKQPKNVLPSAHAIDREYRVLTALQGSSVPTPEPYRYCEDREMITGHLDWATSAGPVIILRASSSAGRSNGQNSGAAMTITRRSTGWCAGLPSACRKVKPQHFVMATSASPTSCFMQQSRA